MSDEIQLAPVALFVYNRPSHTNVLIESLLANKEAKGTDLFVFSDAGKNDSQVDNVNDVRKIVSEIKGFKSVTVIRQEENLGLAESVIYGVTKLCDEYKRVIVLEDDLVLSPHFLNYMNNALEYYENNDQVMQVSGHMFPVSLNVHNDAVFLPFVSTWGWATWKRSWDKFDPDMKSYKKLKDDKLLRKRFNLDGSYPYFKMLENQRVGKVDSWGIRWNLSVFENSGLVLYPVISLVGNAGFDGSGTNCSYQAETVSGGVSQNKKLDNFSSSISVDEEVCFVIKQYLSRKNRLTTKLFSKLLAMIK